jgi:hypothetical protein
LPVLADPVVATAIDRLLHHSHVLTIRAACGRIVGTRPR